MPSKFFVDENALGLGKMLAAHYGGVVYPGHSNLPEVPRQTNDDVWLTVVGQLNLVVITCDKRIRYRYKEKRAWITHGVRGFVLNGTGSQSTSDKFALVQKHWARVNDLADDGTIGPWMSVINCRGVSRVTL